MGKLRITYKKSAIGYSGQQKDTIRSLGLRKLNSVAVHNDTPAIRGMVFRVQHLVKVEELDSDDSAAAAASDNLELIEGIGPKIAGVLRKAGVGTFAQLAALDTARISDILKSSSRLRLANPESWPEQAALAAAGQWDELKALQERLSAGRRSE